MGRYRFGTGVAHDLDLIVRYIATDNRKAAEALRKKFQQQFRALARNPLMGEARPDLSSDVRQTTLGNYVILFRPVRAGVEIVQVTHGARDWESLFRRPRGEST